MPDGEDAKAVEISLVLGYIATKDIPTTEKKVAVLASLGYSNQQMARICATTPDVVKTLKSKAKKEK